jgi:hypothetical protein
MVEVNDFFHDHHLLVLVLLVLLVLILK